MKVLFMFWMYFVLLWSQASIIALLFVALFLFANLGQALWSLFSMALVMLALLLRVMFFYRGLKAHPRWVHWLTIAGNILGLLLIAFAHARVPPPYLWIWGALFGLGIVAGLGSLHENNRWRKGFW